MHIHSPFVHAHAELHPPRPWRPQAYAGSPVDLGNLLLILLGVALVLLLYPF